MALVLLVREHHAKVCPRRDCAKPCFLCSDTIQDSKEEKRSEVATPLTTRAKRMIQKDPPADMRHDERIVRGGSFPRIHTTVMSCGAVGGILIFSKQIHLGVGERGCRTARRREDSLAPLYGRSEGLTGISIHTGRGAIPFLRPILSTREATTVPKMAELT